MESTAFVIVAVTAIVAQAFLLFLALFEPGLPYKVRPWGTHPPDSKDFLGLLEALTDSKLHRRTDVEVLTNGEVFYEAELEAVRAAQHSIHLEAYIFKSGEVGRRFVAALTERARRGVGVRMVLDAFGSFTTPDSLFRELRAAGGQVEWYHPLRWHTLARLNYRTHRELLIVDGAVGFVGGAGWGDQWLIADGNNPRWRDTMFRVRGDAVNGLQSAFAENWLEASGEILADPDYFRPRCDSFSTETLVVGSSPSTGRSTKARILFQTLLSAAQRSVHITTPYFVPDRSARAELVQAMRKRGVEVVILVPGGKTDIPLTRLAARRMYGELLQAGARIFEYEPAMMHSKSLVIDGLWCIVGSTNFSNRSFGINDEVNLVACDPGLATRLEKNLEADLAASREISYDEWRRRPVYERAFEWFAWLLERQQ